jgi:hypothetical protein
VRKRCFGNVAARAGDERAFRAALLVFGLGRLRVGVVGLRCSRRLRRDVRNRIGRNRLRDRPALRVSGRTLTARATTAARAETSAAIATRTTEPRAAPATAAATTTRTATATTSATATATATGTAAARTARSRVIAGRTAARATPGTAAAGAAPGTASRTTRRPRTTARTTRRSRTTPAIAPAARTVGPARRARDHPASSCGRILRTASATIIVPATARRTHLESGARAIAPGRPLAAARTAGAAAPASTAAATTTETATTAVSVASTATTLASAVAAARLGPRHQIGEVIEVALLLGIRGRILARHHAHEPDVVGAPAHHLERLQQPGQAIALDAQLLFDLCSSRSGSSHGCLVDGRRSFCRGSIFARRLGTRFRRGAGVSGYLGRFAPGSCGRSLGGRRLPDGRLARISRCRFGGWTFGPFGPSGRSGRFGSRRFRAWLGRLGWRLARFHGRRLSCFSGGVGGLLSRAVFLLFGFLGRRRRTMVLADLRRLTQEDA